MQLVKSSVLLRLLGQDLVFLHGLLADGIALGLSQRHVPDVLLCFLDIDEGDCGHEAGRLPCVLNLGVQLVDLLERKTLGLVDHGPREEDANEAAAAPDEEDLRLEVNTLWWRSRIVVDQVWCRVGNGPVEKPVRGCGHGKRLGADLEREDLSSDDPCYWTPRAGEEENVDADEGNCGLLSGLVGRA